MRNVIYWVICILFLLFGLMRLGVGSAMFMHELGVFRSEELSSAIDEVSVFIAKRQDQQLIGLTTLSYVGVIAFMGLSLSLGAIGAIRRKVWGFVLIGVYLITHAGLFINFQTVNRKIIYFILGVVLYAVLIGLFKKSALKAAEPG